MPFLISLKHFCDIVDRTHVFNLLANEKDYSGVALVAAPTRISFINLLTFPIGFRSASLVSVFILFFISSNWKTFSFSKMEQRVKSKFNLNFQTKYLVS